MQPIVETVNRMKNTMIVNTRDRTKLLLWTDYKIELSLHDVKLQYKIQYKKEQLTWSHVSQKICDPVFSKRQLKELFLHCQIISG